MAKKKGAATSADADKAVIALMDKLVEEFVAKVGTTGSTYGKKVANLPSGPTVLELVRQAQTVAVDRIMDHFDLWEEDSKVIDSELKGGQTRGEHPRWRAHWNRGTVLREILEALLKRKLPFSESQLLRLFKRSLRDKGHVSTHWSCLSGVSTAAANFCQTNALGPALRAAIESTIKRLGRTLNGTDRNIVDRLSAVIHGGPQIEMEPGEAWSDAALSDLQGMKAKPAGAWKAFLLHCQTGGKGKITDPWRKKAETLITAVGFASLKKHVLKWFPLVDKPRTQPIERRSQWMPNENVLIKKRHEDLLRGLAWCCGFQQDADLARALMRLAISAYRKIPGKGPRLVSLGNACVAALAMMPGQTPIGQLAILKVKVKFGTAQREIEKAFNAAAEREGLPRDEIEELGVPTYGLETVGVQREVLGDYHVELVVDGSSAHLHWFKEGKPLKSAPAAVKIDHAEEVKDLQASVKDLNSMLPAQRERIDTLFLSQKKWPLALWRERYLDHPLLGTIARRLLWTFSRNGKSTAGIWAGTGLVDVAEKTLNITDDAVVSLWHPIGRSLDEVLGWRTWLERREVVQPFKQAHREVYVLTDTERNTRTYSNRFAAHIVRQHQFNALCLARGWKNRLRLMVDDSYPPTSRLLPLWNLRAEYWVEGAGNEYGLDTNESGVFLHLATDQVRFYRIDAPQLQAHAGGGGYGAYRQITEEPLPLDTIPPLVFSEIMRDVDLFVGVASVGNDPNWADGGQGGRYRDYWENYSFGELSATAQTRRALLERLIPRLKIAERCTLADRFLVVRGNLRSYKIHLGSGNILMTPNDQYLCIVPKQLTAESDRVFLPFEGDNTLSVILSKAFLLANDTKITDPSIVSQLEQK